VAELLPATEVETAAIGAIVPRGMTGSDIDLTKLAITKSLAANTPAVPAATSAIRGLSVDYERRRVRVDGALAELTCREFELLAMLVRADGAVMTREALAELASKCNEEAGLEPIQNIRSMDVYVRRLRVKLGEYADVVHTVRGLGYRFNRFGDVTLFGF
jgi:DNA-binding response OmpR family regulator